jgi:AcrR family transcriptional regulator
VIITNKNDNKKMMIKDSIKNKSAQTKSYHHGNLYDSLLTTASKMIAQDGVDALSLRKLAEKIGVSRTAAYHHFKDKNDLLCAIATQGFIDWQQQAENIFNNEDLSDREKYRSFVHNYVRFATQHPAMYELMFGRTLWKNNQQPSNQLNLSSEKLRNVAYPSFQYQVEMTKRWQEKGLMPKSENTLRLAQVTWGTLHGIARLLIDGIYTDTNNVDEMCDCAVNLFLAAK